MKKFTLFFLLNLFISIPAFAQIVGNSEEPIEISAQGSLEWFDKEQQYLANKDVIVTQGTATIHCDKLIADYRKNETTGNTEIRQITALGSVTMSNEGSTASGDKAIYLLETGILTLTGNNLKIVTPDQTVTAQDRMEYDVNKKQATATGTATLIKGPDSITANTLTAFFADKTQKQEGQSLNKAKAIGNVRIKTATETITGQNADYDAVNGIALITGQVKIQKGPNILEGDKAEVNLKTNISKMFGNDTSGKRVKGIFFPSTQKDLKNE